MKCSEKSLPRLTPPGREGVSWSISLSKILKLKKRSASELERKEVLRGMRMRLNILCKSVLGIARNDV